MVLQHATTRCEKTATWIQLDLQSHVIFGQSNFSTEDRLKITNDPGNASRLRLCPDHPAPQGVEIHPICLQTALLLELLATAIVHSRTCRLDSKGLKLICGEICVMVHRVSGRCHPISSGQTNQKQPWLLCATPVEELVWWVVPHKQARTADALKVVVRTTPRCEGGETKLRSFLGRIYLIFHRFSMEFLCG